MCALSNYDRTKSVQVLAIQAPSKKESAPSWTKQPLCNPMACSGPRVLRRMVRKKFQGWAKSPTQTWKISAEPVKHSLLNDMSPLDYYYESAVNGYKLQHFVREFNEGAGKMEVNSWRGNK